MRTAEDFLAELRRGLAQGEYRVNTIGPLPAPLQRKGGRFRAQLVLHSRSRRALQQAAAALVALADNLPSGKRLRWSVDIDPQDGA